MKNEIEAMILIIQYNGRTWNILFNSRSSNKKTRSGIRKKEEGMLFVSKNSLKKIWITD